jgi:hypothetical protein
MSVQWRTEGVWGFNPLPTPRKSEVFTKPSRIPFSVEKKYVTTKKEKGVN